MKFTEIIDLENANTFLNTTNEEIASLFFEEAWYDIEGNEIKPTTHIKQVKKYISSALSDDGYTSVNYSSKNKGRIFANKMSLQGMAGSIRNYLLNYGNIRNFEEDKKIFDYDMKSAHPTILKYFAKKLDLECPYLRTYIKKRDNLLNKYNINKRDVLICLNVDKNKDKNEFLKTLHLETLTIKKAMIEMPEFKDIAVTDNKKNPISSKANKILCYIENEILQNAIDYVKQTTIFKETGITTPIFDGFHSPAELEIEELNKLNEYGIKWDIKEMTGSIEINNDEQLNNYTWAKKTFEEHVFKLNTPPVYVYLDDDKITHLSKECDIKHIMEDLIYDYVDDKGDMADFSEFFRKWKKDPSKRKFEKMKFNPSDEPFDRPDYYNTFQGFPCSLVEGNDNIESEYPYNKFEKTKILHKYFHTISDEEGVPEYVLFYIADLVQNPGRRPDTGLAVRGEQGTGKDTIVKCAEALIGKVHTVMLSMDELCSNFNSSQQNKLLIHIDESEGKDQSEGKLKSRITATKTPIEKKGHDKIYDDNYARFIFTSNSNYYIKLESDDRRFFVFQISNLMKGNTEFWNEVYEALDDPETMNQFYTELMSIDLKDFHPKLEKCKPVTSQKKLMSNNSIRPQHRCLYEEITNELNQDIDECFKLFNIAKNGNYYFTFTDFKNKLKDYYKDNHLNLRENKEIDPHHLATLLEQINISSKSVRSNGKVFKAYTFDIQKVKTTLESMYPTLNNIQDDIIDVN